MMLFALRSATLRSALAKLASVKSMVDPA